MTTAAAPEELNPPYDVPPSPIPLGIGVHSFGVPSGIIVGWAGTLDDVPDGWEVCDGSNGTPDLTDAFIVGAGNNYAVGDQGGQDSVTLTESQIPSHSHGDGNLATDNDSHSHGSGNYGTDNDTHSHGDGNLNTGSDSHSHGVGNLNTGSDSHSHGDGNFSSSLSLGNTTGNANDAAAAGSSSLQNTLGLNVAGNSDGDSHSHNVTGTVDSDNHAHSVSGTTNSDSHVHDVGGTSNSDSHSHLVSGNTGTAGGGTSFDNRPVYYALFWIRKT